MWTKMIMKETTWENAFKYNIPLSLKSKSNLNCQTRKSDSVQRETKSFLVLRPLLGLTGVMEKSLRLLRCSKTLSAVSVTNRIQSLLDAQSYIRTRRIRSQNWGVGRPPNIITWTGPCFQTVIYPAIISLTLQICNWGLETINSHSPGQILRSNKV